MQFFGQKNSMHKKQCAFKASKPVAYFTEILWEYIIKNQNIMNSFYVNKYENLNGNPGKKLYKIDRIENLVSPIAIESS